MIDKSMICENLPDVLFFIVLNFFKNCMYNLIDREEQKNEFYAFKTFFGDGGKRKADQKNLWVVMSEIGDNLRQNGSQYHCKAIEENYHLL